ncbi:MAG: TlpA family protein disulfide reductase [Planctomycetes bacterium]|nr:TlpA family protein disulfide reductase [Planctomycetota bacterium]
MRVVFVLVIAGGLAAGALLLRGSTHAPSDAASRSAQSKPAPRKRPCELMVGDVAPAFAPKAWAKGPPVTALERGRVYVIDFWSTSASSSRMSMEALTRLAKKYAGKVDVIGVNGFEARPDQIDAFVATMGEKIGYPLALDDAGKPDPKGEFGTLAKAWMQAAAQNGVPASFLVAGDGRIAFIGHPMAGLEPALEALLAGKFDFAAAAEAYARELEPRLLLQRIVLAKVAGDRRKQADAILEYLAFKPEQEAKLGLDLVTALFDLEQYDEANKWCARLVDGAYKDEARQLNELAWLIVDPARKSARRDLVLARKAVERALELLRQTDVLYPGALDTHARVYFHEGNLAKAREIQARAVALCKDPELKQQLEATLAEYRK